jgi:hypothetical protein
VEAEACSHLTQRVAAFGRCWRLDLRRRTDDRPERKLRTQALGKVMKNRLFDIGLGDDRSDIACFATCALPRLGRRPGPGTVIDRDLALRSRISAILRAGTQCRSGTSGHQSGSLGGSLRGAADQVECRVEGRPRRDAFRAREGTIVRLDLLGVVGTIAAVGLFVAGQRRRVEFALGRRQ